MNLIEVFEESSTLQKAGAKQKKLNNFSYFRFLVTINLLKT